MWFEKLFAGVLRVLTPLGPRYIKPSLAQRIYLLWVFRHFQSAAAASADPRQRRVIDAMCVEPGSSRSTEADGWERADPGNPGAPPAGRSKHRRRAADSRDRGSGVAVCHRSVATLEHRS